MEGFGYLGSLFWSQVARDLRQKFNRHFYQSKSFFPQPEPILPDSTAARLRSLRNPEKKMSKSDPDTKSCIYLTDSPDVIAGKVKACVTDSIKELSLCPETRPGVANLMVILSELRGCSLDQASHCPQMIHIGKNISLRFQWVRGGINPAGQNGSWEEHGRLWEPIELM